MLANFVPFALGLLIVLMPMKYPWSKSVLPIAALFSFRMLGLFMLIPVFTVFADKLTDATPALIGIALGGYGLSQGLLQMPLGWLSDRIGRKPVLIGGLLLFIIGSLVGAMSESIYGMILARILQGMGAIGSVLIALLADLTPDNQRTKAMAVIGVTIGISFSLAMVISPAITHYYGLSGIFYLTAVLATTGILLLHVIIPTPDQHLLRSNQASPSLLKLAFFNRQLQQLNAGIFFQHFVLTATFYLVPLVLREQAKQGMINQQWHFYLPLMVLAFILMVPFIHIGERKQLMKPIFFFSVICSGFSQLLLALTNTHWFSFCLFMLSYFIAFNILEASLPAMVSRVAPPQSKGTAMGIYSSSQFLGIFAGGSCAGVVYQYGGNNCIFYVNALICFIWAIIAWPRSNKQRFPADIPTKIVIDSL